MAQDSGKKRTIFILYIPGGAMLGIIPAVVLARLEELTETPTAELFQAFDGVSTGSVLAAGMNVPGMTGAQGTELFCKNGPSFFPSIPGRTGRMLTANIVNVLQDYLDPAKADELLILELGKLCDALRAKMPADSHAQVDVLEEKISRKWLTPSRKKDALRLCEKLARKFPGLEEDLSMIGELVFARTSCGRLSMTFKRAAVGALEAVKWCMNADDPDKYMYDPENPRKTYMGIFGERRLSDCTRSIYISTYDARNNRVITFFNRRKDFFSMVPEIGSETSPGNHKLWDVVMASTANPYAFPPHKTEDGIVCVDKAVIHPPFAAVNDIMEHKPADADVKIVILGTGKYLKTLPEDMIVEYYKNIGVLGNLMKGREIAELEGYIMSASHAVLCRTLGKDAVIDISPRLVPHTYSEAQEFPARDSLNASEDNIKKILRQARNLLVAEDDRIRELAHMLAENLYNLGQMSEEKYKRVRERIGVKSESKPLETGIGKEIPNIYKRIFGMPTLRQMFSKWASDMWRRKSSGAELREAEDAPPLLPPPSRSPLPPGPAA